MKSKVKKKTDLSATGNKPIKLLQWEKQFLERLNAEENAVFAKIPGAVAFGTDTRKSGIFSLRQNESKTTIISGSLVETNTTTREIQHGVDNSTTSSNGNVSKQQRLLAAETKETKNLSTSELQR
ncbi:unnamed protein product [Psylliodes chrysocephalus]|uniref:Uncharacterized protein n=1 Tax=Psylliodes chrysocephalus TaxID=3402493 RepID=A0A9P0CNA9_9CUCU|nr:unnamed protein product [Psylliodes chrysocephala]